MEWVEKKRTSRSDFVSVNGIEPKTTEEGLVGGSTIKKRPLNTKMLHADRLIVVSKVEDARILVSRHDLYFLQFQSSMGFCDIIQFTKERHTR